jgi:hypothetical protein
MSLSTNETVARLQPYMLADRCQSAQCMAARAAGAEPCYPFAWQADDQGVIAFYHCARCGRWWPCAWGHRRLGHWHNLRELKQRCLLAWAPAIREKIAV